jgi:hypothetical protein
MALQFFVEPWPLFSFLMLYTVGRTPWSSDQPVARPLPTNRATQTENRRKHRHPRLQWDSNPRSQLLSERRQFIPQTARTIVIGPKLFVQMKRYTKEEQCMDYSHEIQLTNSCNLIFQSVRDIEIDLHPIVFSEWLLSSYRLR